MIYMLFDKYGNDYNRIIDEEYYDYFIVPEFTSINRDIKEYVTDECEDYYDLIIHNTDYRLLKENVFVNEGCDCILIDGL